jgi:ketosteroid isomerase-like protein
MIQMLILVCCFAFFAETPERKAEKEVRTAMDAWTQTMIARDRAALEALYAPGLMYTHSNGKEENKAEAIDAVINGGDRIESIDLRDMTVSTYGTTALVKAKVTLRLSSGGTASTLALDVLHVWIKISSRWQIIARQAIRLSPN